MTNQMMVADDVTLINSRNRYLIWRRYRCLGEICLLAAADTTLQATVLAAIEVYCEFTTG